MRSLILPLLLLVVLSVPVSAAEPVFAGRMIDLEAARMMVKMGWVEKDFVLGQELKVRLLGKDAGREALRVCQMVRVQYRSENGKAVAVLVEITRESDCVPVPGVQPAAPSPSK